MYCVVKNLVLSRYKEAVCAKGLSEIPLCGSQNSGALPSERSFIAQMQSPELMFPIK